MIRRRLGRALGPQFTIRLASTPSRRDPDLMAVPDARTQRLTPTYLDGRADVVFEIASPDS